MGKKILNMMLLFTVLSGSILAIENRDIDTPDGIVQIAYSDLFKYKEQLDLINKTSDEIEQKQIDQHEQTTQELQTLKQEFSYLKQQNIRLEQEVVEVNQQNAEIKQQNLKLEQKMDQQSAQTNISLEQILQKLK